MSMAEGDVFHFAEFTLDAAERRLLRDGAVIRLPPKALDLLITVISIRARFSDILASLARWRA